MFVEVRLLWRLGLRLPYVLEAQWTKSKWIILHSRYTIVFDCTSRQDLRLLTTA